MYETYLVCKAELTRWNSSSAGATIWGASAAGAVSTGGAHTAQDYQTLSIHVQLVSHDVQVASRHFAVPSHSEYTVEKAGVVVVRCLNKTENFISTKTH